MPFIRERLLVLLLSVFLAGCAHCVDEDLVRGQLEAKSAEWLYIEHVVYQDNHDPSNIDLTDGRDLMVTYGNIAWDTVQQWKAGRELELAYSESAGFVLVDSKTMQALPVIAYWGGQHPVDILLENNLELDLKTLDIEMAYDASTDQWDHEISRLYDYYLTSEKVCAALEDRALPRDPEVRLQGGGIAASDGAAPGELNRHLLRACLANVLDDDGPPNQSHRGSNSGSHPTRT